MGALLEAVAADHVDQRDGEKAEGDGDEDEIGHGVS
jgi:hypothetical protein